MQIAKVFPGYQEGNPFFGAAAYYLHGLAGAP
jgi:hypothetical protein